MSKSIYAVVYTWVYQNGVTTNDIQGVFSSKEDAEQWLEENPNNHSSLLCSGGSQIEEWELQ